MAPITSATIPLARAWSQGGKPNTMVFMQEMCNLLCFAHLYLIFHFLADLNQTLLWFHVTLVLVCSPRGLRTRQVGLLENMDCYLQFLHGEAKTVTLCCSCNTDDF